MSVLFSFQLIPNYKSDDSNSFTIWPVSGLPSTPILGLIRLVVQIAILHV